MIGSSIRVTLPESVSFGIKRERADVFWLSALSRCVRFTTSWGFFCLAMAMASSMESGVALAACKIPKSKQIVTVRFIVLDKITNGTGRKWRILTKKQILLLNVRLFCLDGGKVSIWAFFLGTILEQFMATFCFQTEGFGFSRVF